MSLRLISNLHLRLVQETSTLLTSKNLPSLCSVRGRHTKHWEPKWKKLRTLKAVKIDLPNFHEDVSELTDEQMRSKLKEKGLLPPRPWVEKPYFISATGGIFEPYVPPEGDGKISPITTQGAKQKLQYLEKKSKTMMAIRKIRTFDEEFDTPEFCEEAEKKYIKMHELMAAKDLENLPINITERAYPEVIHNTKSKTIHWKFLKNIELPRVVYARCTDMITKNNIFAQLTVRFHTKQILAIYDRFGRLMHGSEIIAKDVLEYVVFEKHLANEYGTWRIHGKIIPDWLPKTQPTIGTYKKSPEPPLAEPETPASEIPEETKIESDAKPLQLAT